jgi:uncharacterized membrane protein
MRRWFAGIPLLLFLLLTLTALTPGLATGAPEDPRETVTPAAATAIPGQAPVARAVLFYSPTCPHCHYVITEILPGLFTAHGAEATVLAGPTDSGADPAFYMMSNGSVQILLVDVTQPDGSSMFTADSTARGITDGGVPRLDVGDVYLVGSVDIPDTFPELVDQALASDGLGWPAIQGLDAALEPFREAGMVAGAASTPPPADATTGAASAGVVFTDGAGPLDRFSQDPLANSIALIMLILLIASLVAAPLLAARGEVPAAPAWSIVLLAVAGMVVAGYLATIEGTGGEAVCGPVGDCNAVQSSQYARIFGIHVGVLGFVGYLLIALLWTVSRLAHGSTADLARMAIATGAFVGVLFSVYLTYLEAFVIGATCMWCITSAVIMLALLWCSVRSGRDALARMRGHRGSELPSGA